MPAIRILPASSSSRDRADRLGVRDLRVGPVELVEPDGLDAEPLERGLAGLAQVLGRAVDGPAAVAGAQVAALGGDEHAGGVAAVGGERLGDQRLVVADLVGVAGGRRRRCR